MSVDGSGSPVVPVNSREPQRVEADHRAGLRQAVALVDDDAGHRLPLVGDRAQHRGAAAAGQLQARPVDLLAARVRHQPGIEGVHAHEDGGPRRLQRVDEGVEVARIRHQPVVGADREEGDEVHHQREDVVQRDRGDDDLARGSSASAGMKALNCSTLATRLRCDSAAPFDSPVVPPVYCRNSRSSPLDATGVKGSFAPSASASAKRTLPARRASTGGLGSCLPLPSPTPLVMTVFSWVLAEDLGHRGRHAAEDDDDLDARVVELVLQLARRVQRVDVHLRRAGADDAEKGDREGQQVGRHHRDAVALLHAELVLQVGGEVARQAVHVGIAQASGRHSGRPAGRRSAASPGPSVASPRRGHRD